MNSSQSKIAQMQHRAPAGFSLVEIMVGMVIAMLGILVMTQVFQNAEGQKRTTTGGDDAQNSGAIALFEIQRDIRVAGWGLANFKTIGCDVITPSGLTLTNLAPVTINPPAALVAPSDDPNTDTLLVVYGSTNGSTEGDGITAQPAPATYAVQTPTSFNNRDFVMAIPQVRPSPCSLTLTKVSGVPVAPNVTVTTGVASMSNGTLYNLGRTLTVIAYRVYQGNLMQCDLMVAGANCSAALGAGWVRIGSNIVSLRAQYGKDTDIPMDGIVNDNGWNQVMPANACEWSRTSAVRLALVARSGLLERSVVTTVTPAWEGSAATGGSTGTGAAAPINLLSNSSWQNYRYKVFQTVVPIRNLSWLGAQSGC